MQQTDWFDEWVGGDKPILADGAMGTMIHSRGVRLEACFDELNLLQPELVMGIHRDYIEAGAQIIETNTFGANRYKLAEHGLSGQVEEINRAGVELAREASRLRPGEIRVAGSIGPLGIRLAPFGRVQPEEAFAAYQEQMEALLQAGVDLLILETQNDLHEVREAVRAARSLTEIPLIATMTFTRDDRTLLGDTPQQVATSLAELEVDLIGANCSTGPAQLLRILERMRSAAPEYRFSVMPNAGWPERVSGRIMYPATAEYFADYVASFCRSGAVIVGGCCGTTPAHIANMRAAIDSLTSPCIPTEELSVAEEPWVDREQALPPTELATRLKTKEFVITVEMDPPRGFSTHKLLAGAHLLAEAGADAVNVADSPMARMRMSPWAACQLIQQEVGVEAVLHFPTRGRNLLRVQGDLLAAHAVGVRNVFVMMGDPTAIGDYPEAMDNYDLVPSGLIHLIQHRFNAGVDHSGADIGEATSFFVGCALNVNASDLEREMRILHKKVKAGADFALTQPVFEVKRIDRFLAGYRQRYGALEIPLLAGILPLYNPRHAAFLHNEVPGIHIPEPIHQRMASAKEPAYDEGGRIAVELLQSLQGIVQGAYLMPPFNQYNLAADIIESIRTANPYKAPVR